MKLTISENVKLNILPEEVENVMPHWQGGSTIETQGTFYTVEETFDEVINKMIEVAQ